MNNRQMYDNFSDDYDRFVNWDGRLAIELPFLISKLSQGSEEKTVQKIRVLDAACGTGQHLIALAKQGFNCTGSDISEKMIAIAKETANAAKLSINFKQVGFGQLSNSFDQQSFDSLICLGNSLPHVLEEEEMITTLTDFHAVLRPGGRLVIQNRNFDSVLQDRNRWMEPQTYHEADKTWIFCRFYDFDADGLITLNIIVLSRQDDKAFQQKLISTRLWPIKKAQLEHYLQSTGFVDIQTYGDLKGSPFDQKTSGNLVITARVAD